jgi:hypothetical protein
MCGQAWLTIKHFLSGNGSEKWNLHVRMAYPALPMIGES